MARWSIVPSERHPSWWDIHSLEDGSWQGATNSWHLAIEEVQSLDALRYGRCPLCSSRVWPTADHEVFVCEGCCETLLRSELVAVATYDTMLNYILRNNLEHDHDYRRMLENAR